MEPENELLGHLANICEDIAKGRFTEARDLFEMTRVGCYPATVTGLAEAFGMMLVKVEAREYRLEHIIEELKAAKAEVEKMHLRLAKENKQLKRNLRSKFSPGRIIGQSRPMVKVLEQVEKIADTPVNVLITGETGTGKELVAKSLHYNSLRSEQPFVALNCASIPKDLFEAELFGIERGVATGVEMRIGRIEQAHGGTLFLDEIGDMSLESQVKILRVIEERMVERVGGRKPIPVDVRLVAATNKELKAEVEEGNFREDLFYRLNVVGLHLPSLRERRNDIPLLLNYFLREHVLRMGVGSKRLAPGVAEALKGYHWPGNVRELDNEVERAVVLSHGEVIRLEDFSSDIQMELDGKIVHRVSPSRGGVNLADAETDLIRQALGQTGGNKAEAARRLGISREGLRKKMKRLGVV
ncbi:MAG: sigma-54 interaction domain-containing protein [Desulfovibrio sp.]|uniref:sigma-54 interaction domain-containing protein n=1 Tax=Desulfovibrio sp. 7SRBS1 TaxID=3378064 RepID=UPI003B3FB0F6